MSIKKSYAVFSKYGNNALLSFFQTPDTSSIGMVCKIYKAYPACKVSTVSKADSNLV